MQLYRGIFCLWDLPDHPKSALNHNSKSRAKKCMIFLECEFLMIGKPMIDFMHYQLFICNKCKIRAIHKRHIFIQTFRYEAHYIWLPCPNEITIWSTNPHLDKGILVSCKSLFKFTGYLFWEDIVMLIKCEAKFYQVEFWSHFFDNEAT